MNILDFLKARVMEDGELARLAMAQSPDPWTADRAYDQSDPSAYLLNDGGSFVAYGNGYTLGPGQEHEAIVKHIVRNQPVRAWADHQAKLAIIAVAETANSDGYSEMRTIGYAEGLEEAIRLLAQTYSDHPDFDPSWTVA